MPHPHNHASDQVSAAPRLSKSKFLSGLQCHKRLYLEIHQPHLATPPDPATRAILDMGTEIGELARRRFPGGALVTAGFRQRDAALAQTAAMMGDPNVPAIFEGAFEHEGVLVRADVLERMPTGWRLIEVKSSSRVKDVHVYDLAIQSHVVIGAGVPVAGVCLMHIDTGYVYAGGDVDLERLFAIEDLTEEVAARREHVPEQLASMKAAVGASSPPAIEPDHHCHSPYECPFWAHCTRHKPARWIYHLPGGKHVVRRLVERGVTTIDGIPDGTPLSPAQRRVKDNVEWISPKLGEALRTVRYPVHHVDFETVMLAIPRFAASRPYQSIPVQWSNHVEQESGKVRHSEFLHGDPSEPRRRWAEALIESVGESGSIVVYSAYEEAMMRQLVEAFPEFRSAFASILKRLWDLHPVIKEHYYHPDFQGSYSIKSVLPAIVPASGYGDLTIQDGGQAAGAYYRMVFVETDWIEKDKIREALSLYCARDTLAMVKLRKTLLEKANASALH